MKVRPHNDAGGQAGRLMTDEDYRRSAAAMIFLHGRDAASCATMRADQLAAGGSVEASAIWRELAEAIRLIQTSGAATS